jgi:hypothetical protein
MPVRSIAHTVIRKLFVNMPPTLQLFDHLCQPAARHALSIVYPIQEVLGDPNAPVPLTLFGTVAAESRASCSKDKI